MIINKDDIDDYFVKYKRNKIDYKYIENELTEGRSR